MTVYKKLYPIKLNAYTASVCKAKIPDFNDVICKCPSCYNCITLPISYSVEPKRPLYPTNQK